MKTECNFTTSEYFNRLAEVLIPFEALAKHHKMDMKYYVNYAKNPAISFSYENDFKVNVDLVSQEMVIKAANSVLLNLKFLGEIKTLLSDSPVITKYTFEHI